MDVEADAPFSDAVRVAFEFAAIAAVLATNEAVAAFCGTVIDAGTVSAAELEASATMAPPAPAAPLRVTEQVAEPDELSEALLHDTPVTVTAVAAEA
jgi:hypothetical protein